MSTLWERKIKKLAFATTVRIASGVATVPGSEISFRGSADDSHGCAHARSDRDMQSAAECLHRFVRSQYYDEIRQFSPGLQNTGDEYVSISGVLTAVNILILGKL